MDLARVYYTELINDVYKWHETYQQRLRTKDLQLIHQESRGYYLAINQSLSNKYTPEELQNMLQDKFVQTIEVTIFFDKDLRVN